MLFNVSRLLSRIIFRNSLFNESIYLRGRELWDSRSSKMEVSLFELCGSQFGVQIGGLCSEKKSVLVQPVFNTNKGNDGWQLSAVLDDSLSETSEFLLGPPSVAKVHGVQSVYQNDAVDIAVKEIKTAELKGCVMSLTDRSNPLNKIGFVRPKDGIGEQEVEDLLQLVILDRPSVLFHFAPHRITASPTYLKWLRCSVVEQHVFVDGSSILGKSASLEDEKEFLKLNPHPCTVVPLRLGQTFPIINGKIITNLASSLFGEHAQKGKNTSEDFFQSGQEADARKMQKEYERSRKAYANEQCIGVMKKREKVQKSNYNIVNKIGSITLHVLNNGAPGTKPSVALSCAGKIFLFNCGEGTQLAMLEGSKNLKNVAYVFVTSSEFETFAGLLPLILSSEIWGAAEIVMHGPRKFEQFMRGSPSLLKFFDNFELRNVRCENILEKPVDDMVTVRGLEVKSQDTSKPSNLCYICHLPERPGAFSVAKAKGFGLKPGPLVGRLKKGETVVLDDGTTIRPEDVVESGIKYPPVLIIDVKDESYLDSLVNNSQWNDLQSSAYLIVHLATNEIVSNSSYKTFIQRVSDETTEHVYLNEKTSVQSSVEGVYHVNYLLNQCSSALFPLIHGSALKPWETEGDDKKLVTVGTSYHLWKASGKLSTQTGLSLTKDAFVRTDPKFYEIFGQSTRSMAYDQVLSDTRLKKIAKEIEESLRAMESVPKKLFPRLICLGTSSAGPSKYRNVSGYYFQINPQSAILLDCGENSYSQLCRHFGSREALEKLTQIGLIFLSHTHADHISGLPLLLSKRLSAFRDLNVAPKPLTVICPTFGHVKHLNSLEQEFELKMFNKEVDSVILCEETIKGFQNSKEEVAFRQNIETLGLKNFACVPVDHRTFKSFGCSFVTNENFKVAYSGDTLPCRNLANAAESADLLIHEATHTDDKKYEAFCAKHTTISEALKMHKISRSKFILLTHFTHRYSKCVPVHIPELSWEDVGIAFDHLDITPDQYCILPKLVEAYKMVFQDHLDRFKDSVFSKPIDDLEDIICKNDQKVPVEQDVPVEHLESQIVKKAKLEST